MATTTDSVDLVGDDATVNLARAALFAALVGAFAYVSFPFPLSPIPITLQVLGVFLAGVMLGPVWGGLALVLYLAAGALGAPVFSAGSGGLGVLLGAASLGYLWSYPLAAAVIGAIVHRGAGLRDLDEVGVGTFVLAMAVGTLVIYALGAAGLYVMVPEYTVADAVVQGAVVFLPAEAVKMAAAVGIVRSDAIAAA